MTPKFRAWDKDQKKMRQVRDIAWDAHGGLDVGYSCDPLGEYRGGSDTLMQFTGRHDDTGKTIFEGDILDADERIYGRLFKRVRGEVQYSENAAAFILYINGDPTSMMTAPVPEEEGGIYAYGVELAFLRAFHIVGNVHENPELLKADAKVDQKVAPQNRT